ncbi:MAG: DMT family transporter [Nitriliruptoraceae bacterium]
MGALLALGAAISFGVSDVAGAVASRRSPALTVAIGMQFAGFPVLLAGLWWLSGTPSVQALLLGALAGSVGNIGLVLYLRSMAVGPIGVISPISAVVGAGVPVTWGVLVAGDPLTAVQVGGIVAGLAAVVLVAWSPGASLRAYGSRGPIVAFVAGLFFGFFFIALDATPADSGLWPLLGARVAGSLSLIAFFLWRGTRPRHGMAVGLIVLSGTTDMLANVLFLLATRSGLLSLASLLASLYPVVALLIARQLLHERLRPIQALGVAVALAATLALVA